jgi:hypothetical protein
VPEVFEPFFENDAPDGTPEAVSELMFEPSGSLAVTLTESGLPSATVAVAGATTTGGAFVFVTVTTVVSRPVSELEAMKMTL